MENSSSSGVPGLTNPVQTLARSQTVLGWGMAIGGQSEVIAITSQDMLAQLLAWASANGKKIALRGSGCSYGDAACGQGKLVLDMSGMNKLISWDAKTGRARAEAGFTIADLWRLGIADGWWPPVVSGTMEPTLGGAAAMNIHGKNAYRVGPIGDHIHALKICRVDGTFHEVGRDDPLFLAIISGFGELAVICEVEIQLKKVYSGELEVLGVSVPDIDKMFDEFERLQDEADYLVSWVDAFAGGSGLGRGLIHAAYQLKPGQDANPGALLRVEAQQLPPRLFGLIPKSWMWMFLKPFSNQLGMRLINWAKQLSGALLEHGKRYRQTHGAFHFLLDYVPNWKFIYKPHGMIQHQIFVPKAAARQVFRQVLQLQQQRGMPSFLAVMKRHRPDQFLMTHGLDGYSLAQDFPVTPGNRARLWALAAEIEALVVKAGGRFYFAKDATLKPETVLASWPAENLRTFARLRKQLDPGGVLSTDLYQRAVEPALRSLGELP